MQNQENKKFHAGRAPAKMARSEKVREATMQQCTQESIIRWEEAAQWMPKLAKGKRRLLLFRHKCYVAATVDVDVINDASRAPARGYAAAAYAAHGVTRGRKRPSSDQRPERPSQSRGHRIIATLASAASFEIGTGD